MKHIMPYMTKLNFLIPLVWALLILATPSKAQNDSIRVENLLVMDTVALQLKGPSIDVTFYLNGIVFLSNTKYHQKMIPDHINFGEIASYFVPLEYIALENSKPLFNNDPFPYSPGGTSYTRDFHTVYFKAASTFKKLNTCKSAKGWSFLISIFIYINRNIISPA